MRHFNYCWISLLLSDNAMTIERAENVSELELRKSLLYLPCTSFQHNIKEVTLLNIYENSVIHISSSLVLSCRYTYVR